MAQESGKSRPINLTDAQVKELAAGRLTTFGEPSRPRDLSAKDVEALREGKAMDLEKKPALRPVAQHEGLGPSTSIGTRPRSINDQDVQALRKGLDIGLEKREPLKQQ
jgi:hypothetical protein